MNVKIKASGVYCLINEDYDRVYTALKAQFTDETSLLFTERVPGYEYLQWELPGTGWVSLAEGDPLMAQEVKRELIERQQAVMSRFGANQDMALRVLAVPDDSFVYYKAQEDGSMLIRLTAWGYKYPERINGGQAVGTLSPKDTTEHVKVKVLYDGKPYADKSLKLNGFNRVVDSEGVLDIGDLPIGYQFDVDADGIHEHVTVAPGKSEIILDLTSFSMVDVQVVQDGYPSVGTAVDVDYPDHGLQLTTDETGHARVKLPIDRGNAYCTVKVGGETQQLILSGPSTSFLFNFVTPAPAPQPVPEPVVAPAPEPVVAPEPVPEPAPVPPVVTPEKKKWWEWLLIALLLLLLLIITGLTYYFCICLF